MNDSRPKERLRTLGALSCGLGAACLSVVLYTAHPSLPFNPVRLPLGSELRVTALMPQGWKFFTRNPQEEDLSVYAKVGDTWAPALKVPHARATNAFGLDRASRAQGLEIGTLSSLHANSGWKSCQKQPLECETDAPLVTSTTARAPSVCGEILLVRQKPVPWAWRNVKNLVMPSSLLRLDVRC